MNDEQVYLTWFEENAMSPMSQLGVLSRRCKNITYSINGKEVTFNCAGSQDSVGKALHNKVLELGTWKLIRNLDDDKAKRYALLDELTQEAQELGFYDVKSAGNSKESEHVKGNGIKPFKK